MSGFEKFLLPKKKDVEDGGVKGIIKKFLTITDFTMPHAYVDTEFRFINYLDFIVEFDDIDKVFVGEEVIRKAFEPVDEEERYWRPRILYYNFSAVDDVFRFFNALKYMKEVVNKVGLKVVKADIKNHFSAVIFNYILWRVGADLEDVKDAVPYGYKTIVTNTQFKTKWKFLDQEYPGFIPLPGEWDEEGDNTVYSDDSSEYIYVKFPIGYIRGLTDTGVKLISLVVEKETRKVALFNSNYGAIVFYALSGNPVKLQDYLREHQPTTVKPIHPQGKEFFITVVTETMDSLIEDAKKFLTEEQIEYAKTCESALLISDKVFSKGSFISWVPHKYHGTGDLLVLSGETKLLKGIREGESDDWFTNMIQFLDKGLDWGIVNLFAGDLMSDPEYYAPTKEEYLEDLLGFATEEDLEELRRKGYDV